MKHQKQTISMLVDTALQYLAAHNYSPKTIDEQYRPTYNNLIRFAKRERIRRFSLEFGLHFISSHYGQDLKNTKHKYYTSLKRKIYVLHEIQQSGRILSRRLIPPAKPLKYLQKDFDYYLLAQSQEGLRATTIKSKSCEMYYFFKHLEGIGIKSLANLKSEHIYDYLGTINSSTVSRKERVLYLIRGALKIFISKNLCRQELSKLFPVISVHSRDSIPSCFSPDELSSILSAVDRNTAIDKRDYSVLLLAILLGMRVGDIRALELNNIKWNEEIIEFTQSKTGKFIQLPMPKELRLSLLNYLKDSRPQTDSNKVFVKMMAPYTEFTNNNFHYILNKYLTKAKINIAGRKHGMHSMRFSSAGNMLSLGTTMTVIGNILGHCYSDTTNRYLKIDIRQLKKAALEVSVI